MDAQTLSEVMGGALALSRYQELLPGYVNAAKAAGITNPNRAAMWAAQLGHESVGLRYMEEIASGAAYEWRQDLGNVYAGDGVRFKGRGPIQLTGRNNYRAFTRWANANGHTDIDFEANPQKLSEPHWGFLAASYYWTVARPDINTLADARDLVTVTRRINGGTNGLADRQARYNRALAMGARLLPGEGVKPVEKRLDYSRAEVRQDTYYWCGPATCQTIINSKTGQTVPEGTLAAELGTTTNGTDYIGYLANVLNKRIGGGYKVVNMPNDPPNQAQRDALWDHVRGSIDGGQGVAVNIVAPPSNYPRASYTSTVSPAYSGGTVYHYVAVMGYAVDSGGSKHVWVADSGFAPYGYWCSLAQFATLVPPKGYCYPASVWKQPTTEGGLSVSEADRIIEFIKAYLGPNNSDTKDLRFQLTGSRDSIPGDVLASYPGFPQLGKNDEGNNLTVTDAIAAIRADLARLEKKIDGK